MCGCEFDAGLGEDAVDEVDALWRGQEWTVLGVLVEVSDEGVEAGEGDADRPAAQAPRPVIRVGVSEEIKMMLVGSDPTGRRRRCRIR